MDRDALEKIIDHLVKAAQDDGIAAFFNRVLIEPEREQLGRPGVLVHDVGGKAVLKRLETLARQLLLAHKVVDDVLQAGVVLVVVGVLAVFQVLIELLPRRIVPVERASERANERSAWRE